MNAFWEFLFRKNKRGERWALWGTLAFVAIISLMAAYSDPLLWKLGIDIAGTHRNRVVDCKKDRNKNSPYCQDFKARQEANWRGITRFGDSPTAFTLHGR